MQISTQWQPSYTPNHFVIKPKAPRVRGPHKRSYEIFGASKTAKRIYQIIAKSNGITAKAIVEKTGLIGAGQYIKTMVVDELIRIEKHYLPHTNQRVNHYYAN